ncbi:FHA domain-containing protein [Streptomyces sp. 6N223]|uniref:FHA domain-containing protein n=1 Tax=Streptomyces sp. 6N223 TaxID=3457412 RepID=UPI003FD61637
MSPDLTSAGGHPLPPDHASLAFGVPPSPAGTLYVRAMGGGFTLRPREGREMLFGRDREDVHVCVGEGDWRVSRRQGVVTHRRRRWWLRNTGRLPVRLPGSLMLFANKDPVPLSLGYTPVFVRGSGRREHVLEMYVAGPAAQPPGPRLNDPTRPPKAWRLKPVERLVLIVLGQRYLLHEASPQPLAWPRVAEQLNALQPDANWTERNAAHVVAGVRLRLSRAGVPGLIGGEAGEPVGNALNHNLLTELVRSATLVPPDLAVLDGQPPASA